MNTLKVAVPDHMRMIDRANMPHTMSKATLLSTFLVGGVFLSPAAAESRIGANTGALTFVLGAIAVLGVALFMFTGSFVRKQKLAMAEAFTVNLRNQGEAVSESVDRLAKMPKTIHTKNIETGLETTWDAYFFDPAAVLKSTELASTTR